MVALETDLHSAALTTQIQPAQTSAESEGLSPGCHCKIYIIVDPCYGGCRWFVDVNRLYFLKVPYFAHIQVHTCILGFHRDMFTSFNVQKS